MTYIFKEIFLILSLYYIFTKSDLIFFIKQVLSAFLLHYKCKTVVIELPKPIYNPAVVKYLNYFYVNLVKALNQKKQKKEDKI